MNKKQRLLDTIRANPNNAKLAHVLKLAEYVGFVHDRTRSSHKVYKRATDPKTLIPFQTDKKNKSMAKGYQVKQLLNFIEENDLQKLLEDE